MSLYKHLCSMNAFEPCGVKLQIEPAGIKRKSFPLENLLSIKLRTLSVDLDSANLKKYLSSAELEDGISRALQKVNKTKGVRSRLDIIHCRCSCLLSPSYPSVLFRFAKPILSPGGMLVVDYIHDQKTSLSKPLRFIEQDCVSKPNDMIVKTVEKAGFLMVSVSDQPSNIVTSDTEQRSPQCTGIKRKSPSGEQFAPVKRAARILRSHNSARGIRIVAVKPLCEHSPKAFNNIDINQFNLACFA